MSQSGQRSGQRLTIMLAVLVVCAAVVVYRQVTKPPEFAPPAMAQEVKDVVAPETAGNPEALIEVEAFYPLNDSHRFIADYLLDFAEAHPDQVSVVIHDMESTNGRQLWQTAGLDCAGVFINGKTEHEIEGEDGAYTVNFIKRMGTFWTEDDFEALVRQLLKERGEELKAEG